MPDPIRILYVDDDPLDRELVRDALETEHGGFQVTEAASQDEFKMRLAEGDYDLVLSDFNILGYEGLEVIDAVRAKDPCVPVVMVTGTGSEEVAVEAMKRGAADYIIKSPKHIRRLPHTIHTVMEKKHLEERRQQAEKALRQSYEEILRRQTAVLSLAEDLKNEVSERKQAEEALRASERRLRALTENSADGIALLDANGAIRYESPTSAQPLGYSVGELVGTKVFELMHPDDIQSVSLLLSALVEEPETPLIIQFRFRHKDGSWCWLEATGNNLLAEPAVQAIVVNYRDITERKRGEALLRYSLEEVERQHRLLLALSQAAQAVQRARTADEVYRIVGDEVQKLGYRVALLTLTDDQTHLRASHLTFEPTLLRATEKLTGLAGEEVRFPVRTGSFYHRIITEGETVFVETAADFIAEALPGSVRPLAGRVVTMLGLEQGILAPLKVGGETLGLLVVTGTDLSQADVPAVAAFANQAAIAIENARLYEQVHRHVTELSSIYEAAQRLQELRTPEAVAQAILQILEEVLAYELLAVLLIDEHTGRLIPFALSDYGHGYDFVEANEAYVASHDIRVGAGITGWVAQTGQSVRSGDVRQDPRYCPIRDDIRSELCVPLRVSDRVIGVLNMETSRLDAYTEVDQRVLETVAAQIAVAIQNAHLYEQVQLHTEKLEQRVADRTRELSALYEVTAVAGESLDLETMLQRSLERVLAAMRSEMGGIHLLDKETGMLHVAAHRGGIPEVIELGRIVPLEGGLPGQLIEQGGSLVIPDVAADPRVTLRLPSMDLGPYAGVPLRAGGKAVGVLSVARGRGQPSFSEEEIALLISVADQVGVAVESARLHQLAEQAAVMEERRRLARDLHDSVTQSLYSLTLLAETGRRSAQTGDLEGVANYLGRLGEVARQALKEMRLLIYELRPSALEQEGLVGALQQRLDAVEGRAGVEARLLVEEEARLTAPVEVALYHIALEALNNALKHAAATSVTVRLRASDEHAELEVIDDGRGFDPQAVGDTGGMGLITMQERAERLGGVLTILSAPGEGTRVKVNVKRDA